MVKISVINKRETKDLEYSELSLNIEGLSCVYLNTIKRILYNYIPTYAFNFDTIKVDKLKSFMNISRLKDRLMYIPILNVENNINYLDDKYFKDVNFENEERDKHPEEKSFIISVKNYNNKEEHKPITTKDINYFINGKISSNPYNIKWPILLCYLRNGDFIDCTLKSSLCIGKIHPIYQPVYHTYFKENGKGYNLIIHSKGQQTETELLKRCCKVAIINLTEIKKKSWNMLHSENKFLSLVYEYKAYKENENMKLLTFDDFTFANIICEELQNNKDVDFAGVNKDNYIDETVQLRIRFKTQEDKKQQQILNNSIDECINKFKEIEKLIKF